MNKILDFYSFRTKKKTIKNKYETIFFERAIRIYRKIKKNK